LRRKGGGGAARGGRLSTRCRGVSRAVQPRVTDRRTHRRSDRLTCSIAVTVQSSLPTVTSSSTAVIPLPCRRVEPCYLDLRAERLGLVPGAGRAHGDAEQCGVPSRARDSRVARGAR
jgi:hypothetical protein